MRWSAGMGTSQTVMPSKGPHTMKLPALQQRRAAIITEIGQIETTADAASRNVESRELQRVDALTAELETLVKRIKFATMTDAAEQSAQANSIIPVDKFDVSIARN